MTKSLNAILLWRPASINPKVPLVVVRTNSGAVFLHCLMKKNGEIASLKESGDFSGSCLDVDTIVEWYPVYG